MVSFVLPASLSSFVVLVEFFWFVLCPFIWFCLFAFGFVFLSRFYQRTEFGLELRVPYLNLLSVRISRASGCFSLPHLILIGAA